MLPFSLQHLEKKQRRHIFIAVPSSLSFLFPLNTPSRSTTSIISRNRAAQEAAHWTSLPPHYHDVGLPCDPVVFTTHGGASVARTKRGNLSRAPVASQRPVLPPSHLVLALLLKASHATGLPDAVLWRSACPFPHRASARVSASCGSINSGAGTLLITRSGRLAVWRSVGNRHKKRTCVASWCFLLLSCSAILVPMAPASPPCQAIGVTIVFR